MRVIGLTLFLLFPASCERKPLPRRQLATSSWIHLSELWTSATFVAVGAVSNLHVSGPSFQGKPFGEDRDVTVFPCEAEFTSTTVLKGGQLANSPARLFWYSYFPNCAFGLRPYVHSPGQDQVWFLRWEDGFLRPIADHTWAYLQLLRSVSLDGSQEEMRAQFARAVLSPGVLAGTDADFVKELPEVFPLACKIVGEPSCYAYLGGIEESATQELKGGICYVLAESNECEYSRCPASSLYISLLDPDRYAAEQKGRERNEELLLADPVVERAFHSNQPEAQAELLARLRRLNCNFDPAVRTRADLFLKRYYPSEPRLPCIPCN